MLLAEIPFSSLQTFDLIGADMRLDFGSRSKQSCRDRHACWHRQPREIRYEILHCRGDNVGNGDTLDPSLGSSLGRQRPGAAMHRPRSLFRRTAVCADQHLACQSDAGDNATERRRIYNVAAEYNPVAGAPSPARPDLQGALRPRQSRRSAADAARRGTKGVLSKLMDIPIHFS